LQGRLIVFEGIDGSGKSTQFELLCKRFADNGKEFLRLRFPRYSEPSSALVKMYLGGQFGDDPDSVNAYAASSFYAVDRIASYLQDWKTYYKNGGLVLTDRYTTSNALHQGAKFPPHQRDSFFGWLYDYEFSLLGLPKPDCVIYMDIEAAPAANRLKLRQSKTGTNADIHEQDIDFLRLSAQSGKHAADFFGWHILSCFRDKIERTEEDIHNEVISILAAYLQL